jgi:nicotinamidase-related amidase
MQALLIVDAQNEFSPDGARAVPGHAEALVAIRGHVADARRDGRPIAWVRHHNRPHESPAFRPGSWGAELSSGLGLEERGGLEREFVKDVYGAFTTTGLEGWLRGLKAGEVLVVGFFAHMCISTTIREALVRDFEVVVDPAATGARALEHPLLGSLSAEEVKRSALLQVADMGAAILASHPVGR